MGEAWSVTGVPEVSRSSLRRLKRGAVVAPLREPLVPVAWPGTYVANFSDWRTTRESWLPQLYAPAIR